MGSKLGACLSSQLKSLLLIFAFTTGMDELPCSLIGRNLLNCKSNCRFERFLNKFRYSLHGTFSCQLFLCLYIVNDQSYSNSFSQLLTTCLHHGCALCQRCLLPSKRSFKSDAIFNSRSRSTTKLGCSCLSAQSSVLSFALTRYTGSYGTECLNKKMYAFCFFVCVRVFVLLAFRYKL